MKRFKILSLLVLIPLLYSCSGNLLNEEDPSATLKAEAANEVADASGEFAKAEHIVGYLDGQGEILYIMPSYQEITLERLAAKNMGNGLYEIESDIGNADMVTNQFSIVNVSDRAMLNKLATIRNSEEQLLTEGLEPVDTIIIDIWVYRNAKCVQVQNPQVFPCANTPPLGSEQLSHLAIGKCMPGKDICFERVKIAKTKVVYLLPNCAGPGRLFVKLAFSCL